MEKRKKKGDYCVGDEGEREWEKEKRRRIERKGAYKRRNNEKENTHTQTNKKIIIDGIKQASK